MSTVYKCLQMQRGFTKLFNTIVTSTIWQEDDKTRIVWITMLAIADQYGVVSASIPGLASVSNIEIEATRKAVKNLMSPDPDSRTKDFDGRRIEEIDGGWHVLNYVKYRQMLTEEERKEYKAKWIREKRRQKSTNVDPVDERRRSSSASSSEYLLLLKSESVRERFKEWVPVRKAMGKKPRDWDKMFSEQCQWLNQFNESDQLESISQSIRNNWQGLFEPKNSNNNKGEYTKPKETAPKGEAYRIYDPDKWIREEMEEHERKKKN